MDIRYYIKHMQKLGLVRQVPQGSRAFAYDLGCGRGGDSEYLKSLGYAVISVDKERYYPSAIIADLADFKFENKADVIIASNSLPFIGDKFIVEKIIRDFTYVLIPGGGAFFTVYGPNSGFKNRADMSFFEYDEILSLVSRLPVEIMDKTTSEGYTKNAKGELIYQHSHRFILRKNI